MYTHMYWHTVLTDKKQTCSSEFTAWYVARMLKEILVQKQWGTNPRLWPIWHRIIVVVVYLINEIVPTVFSCRNVFLKDFEIAETI